MKFPHGDTFDVLWPLMPVLHSYVFSFIYVGVYWNKPQLVKCQSSTGGGLHLAIADSHRATIFTFDQGMAKAREALGIAARLLEYK